MKNLPPSLLRTAKKIDSLDYDSKYKFFDLAYNDHSLSIRDIADIADTYPNKIRRMMQSVSFDRRTKSEAQSAAIARGAHPHPTKDKGHSENAKIKISDSLAKAWDNIDDKERKRRSEIGKQQWKSMSDEEKRDFQQKAGDAVRQAAKDGSKLERHLLQGLTDRGFQVSFHVERLLRNENVHLDLFLPNLNVVIEVDGPSHFKPIWGEDNLKKTQLTDQKKSGLILGSGFCLIRILQTKSLSKKTKRDILEKTISVLQDVKKKFPPLSKRYITIGDNNDSR